MDDFEALIADNIDLLEIAKGYCEYNHDKSIAMATMRTMLNVILKNQKNIAQKLDLLSM